MTDLTRRIALLCDFDGTITEHDIGQELLKKYSTVDWEELEKPFARGEIGVLENMQSQFEHVPQKASELVAYARSVGGVRPGWTELVDWCRSRSIQLAVLSGGLDFYVKALLPRKDEVVVHCLAATHTGHGWQVAVPDGLDAAVEFKEAVIQRYRAEGFTVWLVGNGSSDRAAARTADRVWALEPLLSWCREHGIEAEPFESFHDLRKQLERALVPG